MVWTWRPYPSTCHQDKLCFSTQEMLLNLMHWLQVAAQIQIKSLVLIYCAVNGSSPSYIQDMFEPYNIARPLCSSAKWLATASLRRWPTCHSKSRLFVVGSQCWLPINSSTAETPHIFHRRLNSHWFGLHIGKKAGYAYLNKLMYLQFWVVSL